MSVETKIPEIKIIDTIAPVEERGHLHSPLLGKKVLEFGHFEGDLWHAFLEADPGSVTEDHNARELESLYLLKTAFRLQNVPKDKPSLVYRFNEYAESKYGDVDPEEAHRIVHADLASWENVPEETLAKALYRRLDSARPEAAQAGNETLPLGEFMEVLQEMMPEVFAEISKLPEGRVKMPVVRRVYRNILKQMSQRDAGWSEWKVTNPGKDVSNFSTNSEGKEFRAPDGREPFESKEEFLAITLHEMLAHGYRGVNGWKTGDQLAALGLPGNFMFEEGLGKLIEYIVRGKVTPTQTDRYLDIGLATGAVDGIMYSRDEIIVFGVSRAETRALAEGKPLKNSDKVRADLTKKSRRIFRGGDAVPVIGEDGTILNQAVFTKDISYHQEFMVARDFVAQNIAAGFTPKEIMNYLFAAKIDPTDQSHVDYIAQYGIKLQK